MYHLPDINTPLTQGDVIDGCPIFLLDPLTADLTSEPERFELRVLVLTQACDLAQAKTNRVVVALVYLAQDLVDRGFLKASVVRDQIRRGLAYGLYFLPSVTEPVEFPESIVDLRDLHTVPRSTLETLIATGKRVCTLMSPWREHLAQHFGVTYMRIGLPESYTTEP